MRTKTKWRERAEEWLQEMSRDVARLKEELSLDAAVARTRAERMVHELERKVEDARRRLAAIDEEEVWQRVTAGLTETWAKLKEAVRPQAR
jgi:hypothetical protein